MTDQPKDHEETDHEEVVLNRWQRLQQWWQIAKTARAIAMAIKVLFFGTAATAVVDVATDDTLLRDTAIEIGLVDAPTITKPVVSGETEVQQTQEHSHPHEHELVWPEHSHAPHSHSVGSHSHPVADHDHPVIDHVHSAADLADSVKKLLPDKHEELH